MEPELRAFSGVGSAEMVDTDGVEGAGATDDSVHFISFFQKEFAQVGAVLAGDPGDQGFFHGGNFSCVQFGFNIQEGLRFCNARKV